MPFTCFGYGSEREFLALMLFLLAMQKLNVSIQIFSDLIGFSLFSCLKKGHKHLLKKKQLEILN